MTFIVVNLNLNKKLSNNPSYLNEDFSYLQLKLLPNQTYDQLNACKLPQLQLIGHENAEQYKPCKVKVEWGFLRNNRWYFNKDILNGFNNIQCKYRNLTRENDFLLIYSNYSDLTDAQLILNDVIEVVCVANSFRVKYKSLFAQIVNRLKYMPDKLPHSIKTNNKCKPMNILLLSYDSLSRVSWFKRLPKTSEYILNEMKFNLLYGQNILGDGTPACMIPLLAGINIKQNQHIYYQ